MTEIKIELAFKHDEKDRYNHHERIILTECDLKKCAFRKYHDTYIPVIPDYDNTIIKGILT